MVGAGRGLFHGACVASPGLPPRVERRRSRRDPLLFPPTPCRLGPAVPGPAARSPPAAAAWPRWGSGQRTAAVLLWGQGWRAAAMGARATTWQGSRTCRRNVICASLFGVGAPEALVIGVVALLVFGPKGLAEVARNLGKTLRAFQPTIREIQDVSREFRSTLEREIGIDEISQSTNYRPTTMNNNQQPAADPNVKPEPVPYTSEELMKVTEEQIAASAAAAWNPEQPAASQQQEAATDASSEKAAISGGSDGPAAPAPAPAPSAPALAVSNSDPNQVNQSEKAETER